MDKINLTKSKITVITTETIEQNDARVFRLLNEYPGSEILGKLVVTIILEKNQEEFPDELKPAILEERNENQITRAEYNKMNLHFITQIEKLKYLTDELLKKGNPLTSHNGN